MAKVESYNTDREKNPLMKDLHELGLKHGVKFVVVAYGKKDVKTLCIDHEEDTHPLVASQLYVHAGTTLIKASSGLDEFWHEQRLAGKGCGAPFDDGGRCGDLPDSACGSCADLIAKLEAHEGHGTGTAEDGPNESDCSCRETDEQAACAEAGCGFCKAAQDMAET